MGFCARRQVVHRHLGPASGCRGLLGSNQLQRCEGSEVGNELEHVEGYGLLGGDNRSLGGLLMRPKCHLELRQTSLKLDLSPSVASRRRNVETELQMTGGSFEVGRTPRDTGQRLESRCCEDDGSSLLCVL